MVVDGLEGLEGRDVATQGNTAAATMGLTRGKSHSQCTPGIFENRLYPLNRELACLQCMSFLSLQAICTIVNPRTTIVHYSHALRPTSLRHRHRSQMPVLVILRLEKRIT